MDMINYANQVFEDYKIKVRCANFSKINHFNIYELSLLPGCKIKTVESISSELQLRLNFKYKPTFIIDDGKFKMIFTNNPSKIQLEDLIRRKSKFSPLEIVMGIDYNGDVVTTDIAKMPHLLVAGTTGSGKSVFLHVLINNFIKTYRDIDLYLFDPKYVEFESYKNNTNNYLYICVQNTYQETINKLKFIAEMMENRFEVLAKRGYRNVQDYNANNKDKYKYILCIIDEFADLASDKNDKKIFESLICSIAAKSRAAGIHLVIATQRPSIDVVTGLIKANFPTRVCFKVSTSVDSRVVLDQCGAENLMPGGDGIVIYNSRITRFQAAYINN